MRPYTGHIDTLSKRRLRRRHGPSSRYTTVSVPRFRTPGIGLASPVHSRATRLLLDRHSRAKFLRVPFNRRHPPLVWQIGSRERASIPLPLVGSACIITQRRLLTPCVLFAP